MTLKDDLIERLKTAPGQTDRELTNLIFDRSKAQQPVNIAARTLEKDGVLVRRRRDDGLIGNYLALGYEKVLERKSRAAKTTPAKADGLTEDEVKAHLKNWLEEQGWTVEVAWGKKRGVDVEATKGARRWLIEVKGSGSLSAMRVNYFIGMLGELLQRMDDPDADYAIALPNMAQFRGLWERFPALAKKRTGISAIFVATEGQVDQVD